MIDSEIEMKGLGRKHPANTHNKRSLIRTSHVCHRHRAAGRNQQVEEYKHKYTHTLLLLTTFTTTVVNTNVQPQFQSVKSRPFISYLTKIHPSRKTMW